MCCTSWTTLWNIITFIWASRSSSSSSLRVPCIFLKTNIDLLTQKAQYLPQQIVVIRWWRQHWQADVQNNLTTFGDFGLVDCWIHGIFSHILSRFFTRSSAFRFFTSLQRSGECYLFIHVCPPVSQFVHGGGPMWPLPMMYWTSLYSAPPVSSSPSL